MYIHFGFYDSMKLLKCIVSYNFNTCVYILNILYCTKNIIFRDETFMFSLLPIYNNIVYSNIPKMCFKFCY